jgi:RNA polymerase sigma-70 factor (ECF subfamily)
MDESQARHSTNPVLLSRLRASPADQAAWAQFVRHYGTMIYRWCRRWNLQEADAQDVTQNVLTKLAAKMPTFQYDPSRSFRGFLKTLAHGAWSDYLASRARPGASGSGDSATLSLLETVEARDDLVRYLEETFDRELLAEAMLRVRARVERHNWEAFRLLALEGMSGAEVAKRLGLKVGHVFVARQRVQKMVQEEVARLEGPRDDDPAPGTRGAAAP